MQARDRLNDVLGERSMQPDWDVSDDRVTSAEWRVLERAYGGSLDATGDDVLRQAVETLYQLRKAGTTNAPVHLGHDRKPASTTSTNGRRFTHQQALAVLLAKYAAADQNVVAFRQQVVGTALIHASGIEAWLRARATVAPDAQGRPTVPFRLLAYGTPNCDSALHLAVADDGALAPLVDLSERLARTYGWNPAEATLFILTGYIPPARSIRVDFHEDMRLRARSRITLVVDPDVHAQRGGC